MSKSCPLCNGTGLLPKILPASNGSHEAKLAACRTRGPWLRNSLEARRKELQDAAVRARGAFRQEFMSDAAAYLARTYERAADILVMALVEIDNPAPRREP